MDFVTTKFEYKYQIQLKNTFAKYHWNPFFTRFQVYCPSNFGTYKRIQRWKQQRYLVPALRYRIEISLLQFTEMGSDWDIAPIYLHLIFRYGAKKNVISVQIAWILMNIGSYTNASGKLVKIDSTEDIPFGFKL